MGSKLTIVDRTTSSIDRASCIPFGTIQRLTGPRGVKGVLLTPDTWILVRIIVRPNFRTVRKLIADNCEPELRTPRTGRQEMWEDLTIVVMVPMSTRLSGAAAGRVSSIEATKAYYSLKPGSEKALVG